MKNRFSQEKNNTEQETKKYSTLWQIILYSIPYILTYTKEVNNKKTIWREVRKRINRSN